MKREIKFRAWDTVEEIMVIPEKINNPVDSDGPEEINCFVLMQFTGLKDKNGIEIYEGDIISIDNSEPKDEGEYDVMVECKWQTGGFILEDCAGGHWSRQLYHQPHRLFILGNIYENLELLTQQ